MKLGLKPHQEHPFPSGNLKNGKHLFSTSPTQEGKPHALCGLHSLLDLGSGLPPRDVGVKLERVLQRCGEAWSCWYTEERVGGMNLRCSQGLKTCPIPCVGDVNQCCLFNLFVFKIDVFLFYVCEDFTCNYVCALCVCSAHKARRQILWI